MSIIQGLWIGGSLPPMQRLSIASFLAHGHEYHLYAYDDVGEVPERAVVRDASRVLPRERVFQHKHGFGMGSYSTFSNLFRYKLILEQGGWWVDTDLVCLQQFDFEQDYVFGTENDEGTLLTSTCVFKCPPGAECLEYCLRVGSSKNADELKWSEIGPYLFDEAIMRFALSDKCLAPYAFNPIDASDFTDVLKPDFDMSRLARSYGVHLWNQLWRHENLDPDRAAHPDSLYTRLKVQHGV